MRPLRFSLPPLLLAVIGLASGALALGASSLGSRAEGRSIPKRAAPIISSRVDAAIPPPPGLRNPCFPALYAPEPERRLAEGPFLLDIGASSQSEQGRVDRASLIPALANNQILAFYGKPDSRSMGILGEYSKNDLAKILEGYARLYDEQNGNEGIVPAFYLIYGTCWPGGEIGYLKDSVVQEYIDFARAKGWLVFIDHQIGKYAVSDAVKRLLPWLKYPNVHIAIDPEWRTESPMEVIGGVSAEEINAAEEAMSAYLKAEGILGVKMLVVHQFQDRMIGEREKVRADFEGVLLIHTADGFGPPALKRSSYSSNAKASNIPLKGFKLFLKTDVEGAGFDDPLLRPAEVLALDPCPRLIIYQ
jgi:hypothetical protein